MPPVDPEVAVEPLVVEQQEVVERPVDPEAVVERLVAPEAVAGPLNGQQEAVVVVVVVQEGEPRRPDPVHWAE